MAFIDTERGVCISGFKAAGARKGKYGVAVILADRVCTATGVFTRNSVKAAPLKLTRSRLKNGIRAVVANSGNANACTPTGLEDARAMGEHAAEVLGVEARNVAVGSTGIIGRSLDLDTVKTLIREASKGLSSSRKASLEAAKAIMTTDTVPKMFSARYKGIEVGGITKGAGMIKPEMATTLVYLTTNADLSQDRLKTALMKSADNSFNMITVDNDMSTNDMILLLSNRVKKCRPSDLQRLLDHVLTELAKKVAFDGEGATKNIEVEVYNARDLNTARKGAKAVVASPLVKSMFYGVNPNWGRIIAALGSAIKVDYRRVDVVFKSGNKRTTVLKQGVGGDLRKARALMKNREVRVEINLNQGGRYSATAWGCDLTPEYVKINAGYS